MAKGRKKLAMWQGFLAGALLTLGVYLLGLSILTLLLVVFAAMTYTDNHRKK